MNAAPAQIQFVSSLFSSKIFWTNIVGIAAMIASAAGAKVPGLAPGQQEETIGMLMALATMLLRWLAPTGPVSLTAPLSVPAAQDVPAGASIVHVAAPTDALQKTAVQPLPVGTHTVAVAAPAIAAAVPVLPPSVTVTPAVPPAA